MQTYVGRRRQNCRTQNGRNKSSTAKGNGMFKKCVLTIVRQSCFCLAFLCLIYIAKNVNVPKIDVVSDAIKSSLNYNVDVNRIFNVDVNRIFEGIEVFIKSGEFKIPPMIFKDSMIIPADELNVCHDIQFI